MAVCQATLMCCSVLFQQLLGGEGKLFTAALLSLALCVCVCVPGGRLTLSSIYSSHLKLPHSLPRLPPPSLKCFSPLQPCCFVNSSHLFSFSVYISTTPQGTRREPFFLLLEAGCSKGRGQLLGGSFPMDRILSWVLKIFNCLG